MLTRNALVLAASLLALPLQSFATEEAKPKPKLEKVSNSGESMNPWTDCGIGAMLFDETKWAAVTSNIIWDYGLTATTSNVSSKQTCEGKRVVAALFINNTYVNIEEQTANGSGKHLTAMLNILGCAPSAQADIVRTIRSDFSNAMSNNSYSQKSATDKAQQYYFIVDKHISGEYAKQCNAG